MIGPILGPTLGGYLTDMYNWRWVFFINVPFGIAAVAGLVFFLQDRQRNTALRFDWIGISRLVRWIGRAATDARSRLFQGLVFVARDHH